MSKYLISICISAWLLAWLGLTAPPAKIYAGGTIVVTTTDDELNSDGDCSLREAISTANTNVNVDSCFGASATALDDIILADGATYTLTLSGADDANAVGDLDILDNPGTTLDIYLRTVGSPAIINGNDID